MGQMMTGAGMGFIYVGCGGLAGVLARYLILLVWGPIRVGGFPWGTFTVNLVGSFLIGIIYGLGLQKEWLTPELRLGLTTGFLGGFTTFSAFSAESMDLLVTGHTIQAFVYILASVAGGLLAGFSGMYLGRI
jgi:fluoride exporter